MFSEVSGTAREQPQASQAEPHNEELTHAHTHSLTLTRTHSRARTHTHSHIHSLTLTHTVVHAHTHTLSLTLTHSHTYTSPSRPASCLLCNGGQSPISLSFCLCNGGTGPPGPGALCSGTWGCAPGAPRRVGTRGPVQGTRGHAPAALCGVGTRGPAPGALQELLDLELRPLLSPWQPCDSDHWTLSSALKVSPPEDTCCRPCHSTWSTRWLPLPQSIKILTPCPQAHCTYMIYMRKKNYLFRMYQKRTQLLGATGVWKRILLAVEAPIGAWTLCRRSRRSTGLGL